MTPQTAPADAAPPMPPIARVLAVAEPEGGEDLVGAAADLAARHGARLDVLSCVEPPADLAAIARAAGLSREAALDRLLEARRDRMAPALAASGPAGARELHVVSGKAFLEVIRHVLRHDIDVVVKGAERLSGLHGLLFASTDQHLLRKCPCAVWLRTPGARRAPRTVIAAVDVDDWDASEPETLHALNRRVVETALRLVASQDGVVHALHAWSAAGEGLVWTFASDDDARIAAQTYAREIEAARRQSLDALVGLFPEGRAPGGPRLLDRLVRGPAREVIAAEAQRLSADAIVLGTVARTGLHGVIIGNTAEDIVNSVDCSVVAVKPGGFVSPVAGSLRDDGA